MVFFAPCNSELVLFFLHVFSFFSSSSFFLWGGDDSLMMKFEFEFLHFSDRKDDRGLRFRLGPPAVDRVQHIDPSGKDYFMGRV